MFYSPRGQDRPAETIRYPLLSQPPPSILVFSTLETPTLDNQPFEHRVGFCDPHAETPLLAGSADLGGWGLGGWGAGGWVLQGPMGLWCSGGCQKLYGLVRKPVAALHNAAAEPLRHASKNIN